MKATYSSGQIQRKKKNWISRVERTILS